MRLNIESDLLPPMTMQDLASFYRPPSWSTGNVSIEDAQFLDMMVQRISPSEIVEIGVAAGCSSAVLLRALALLEGKRFLFSYDLLDYCYFAPERSVGAATAELASQFIHHWSLNLGKLAVEAGSRLNGHDINLAFIDADHRHPWATLDLWSLLPALAPDGWVILHDIDLARTTEWKVFGPEILFESWPGEKVKAKGRGNIGAVKLPGDHEKARLWLIESLRRPWETDVDFYLLEKLKIPQEVRNNSLWFQRMPEILRNRLLKFKKQGRKVVVWGAGGAGCACLTELMKNGVKPDAFIDRDEAKHGQLINEVPICSIKEYLKDKFQPFVVVASMYAPQIMFELDTMGFIQSKDFICYAHKNNTTSNGKADKRKTETRLLGMTTVEEQDYLFNYARYNHTESGTIVDLGSWLGSTTIPLARGLKKATAETSIVHAYDTFIWQDWMEPHAGELRGHFTPGNSFLPEFIRRLGRLSSRVCIHAGDLTKLVWDDGPIEFLLIDAMKSWDLCATINRNFLPFLLPGKGLVMHQDFKFWGCPWIHLTMYRLRDCFEIEKDLTNSAGTVFRLINVPDFKRLEQPLKAENFSKEEVEEAFTYWSKLLDGPLAHLIDCGKILALVEIGARAQAFTEFEKLVETEFDLHEQFLDSIRRCYPDKNFPLLAEPWTKSFERAKATGRQILMWGAGTGGRNILQQHPLVQYSTEYVLDSDPGKAGQLLKGIPIVGPEILTGREVLPFVIVTSSFTFEITSKLRLLGYNKGNDFCIAELS